MPNNKKPAEKIPPKQEESNPTLELIKRLTQIPGPSGYETRAGLAAGEELAPFATEVKVDNMGSVVAFKRGLSTEKSSKRKKILLAAHLDEIALLVTAIEPGGFLRFTQVGGFDARVLLGQEVLLHPVGRYGLETKISLPGIIGAKPPHFQTADESGRVIPMEDLYIDLGLDEAGTKAKVSIGDLATLRMPFINLINERAAGKAMDNRACVAVMVQTLEILNKCYHRWDVYAVATVQEEVTGLGALTATFDIHPDIGIAIDVTHGDMAGVPENETFSIGKGPTITIGPNIHPSVAEKLKKVARKEEIPHQIEPCAGITGTDAVDIQISREGIPTGLLGLPLRYMHTPVETLAVVDVERSSRLLARFIQDLDDINLEWKDN
jgi:endoglucanase